MPDFHLLLYDYIDFYPLVALIGLLLAGINFPFSEDLIIITGALLSHDKASSLILNLGAIYIGVLVSDFFVYWVGTRARKGASKTSFFVRVIPEKVIEKMHYNLDKYGIFAFIVGRFIPFGVRNTMFFTSGFFNLDFKTFLFYDITAAMISVNTLFFLTYYFGETIRKPLRIVGIILFFALFSAIISLIVRLIVKWRRSIVKDN